jgi:hypothetical protein
MKGKERKGKERGGQCVRRWDDRTKYVRQRGRSGEGGRGGQEGGEREQKDRRSERGRSKQEYDTRTRGRSHAGLMRARAATNVWRWGAGTGGEEAKTRARRMRRCKAQVLAQPPQTTRASESSPDPPTKTRECSHMAPQGRSWKARAHATHMRCPHGDEGMRKRCGRACGTRSKRTERVKEGAGRGWEMKEIG